LVKAKPLLINAAESRLLVGDIDAAAIEVPAHHHFGPQVCLATKNTVQVVTVTSPKLKGKLWVQFGIGLLADAVSRIEIGLRDEDDGTVFPGYAMPS
jgi:hypothetical protein